MRFWDASAVVPVLVQEPSSDAARTALALDSQIVVWWATPVECFSAIARQGREGLLSVEDVDLARDRLSTLSATWSEVEPSEQIRSRAGLLLLRHPLRSGDALQLSAALAWVTDRPKGQTFYASDSRLRTAARLEGFVVDGPTP